MTRSRPMVGWTLAASALVIAIVMGFAGRGDGIRRTYQSGAVGGGSLSTMDVETLPLGTDIAVEALIVDVQPARVDTASGKYPPIDLDGEVSQRHGIYTYTPVIVEVEEILGRRPQMPEQARSFFSDWREGTRTELTVAGGIYTETLSPDEARALEIRVPLNETLEDETEVYPTSPIKISSGSSPAVDLEEGQQAILFLAAHVTDRRVTSRLVGEGQGAFIIDESASAARQALPSVWDPEHRHTLSTVRRLAASVAQQEGHAHTGDELQEAPRSSPD